MMWHDDMVPFLEDGPDRMKMEMLDVYPTTVLIRDGHVSGEGFIFNNRNGHFHHDDFTGKTCVRINVMLQSGDSGRPSPPISTGSAGVPDRRRSSVQWRRYKDARLLLTLCRNISCTVVAAGNRK